MRGLGILGSTGSIGASTLDVVRMHPGRYRVVALSANTDVEGMLAQCREFRPALAAMADPGSARALERRLRDEGIGTDVVSGPDGLLAVATHAEVTDVMAAIVGAAGLLPTLAAVRQGKRVLLANKEALVVSGQIFTDAVRRTGARILPIDSEHNAIFQCLPDDFSAGLGKVGVRSILLTASGGPFRRHSRQALASVTPEQACAHPNWRMGRKISVDSATMMNKGLEVIEARWLFDARPDQIRVVVHPQSVIHSLVQYVDGSVLAQLGNPDMRTPIAHALAWPERHSSGVEALDLFAVARLDFEPPDLERFPCLRLAFRAIEAGGTAPVVLNAANEIAVACFLRGRLGFTAIAEVVEHTLESYAAHSCQSLEDLLDVDREARRLAEHRADALVS